MILDVWVPFEEHHNVSATGTDFTNSFQLMCGQSCKLILKKGSPMGVTILRLWLYVLCLEGPGGKA